MYISVIICRYGWANNNSRWLLTCNAVCCVPVPQWRHSFVLLLHSFSRSWWLLMASFWEVGEILSWFLLVFFTDPVYFVLKIRNINTKATFDVIIFDFFSVICFIRADEYFGVWVVRKLKHFTRFSWSSGAFDIKYGWY